MRNQVRQSEVVQTQELHQVQDGKQDHHSPHDGLDGAINAKQANDPDQATKNSFSNQKRD